MSDEAARPRDARNGVPPARRVHALLEVLRAPLLLSPVADVCAGFAVAVAAAGHPRIVPGEMLGPLVPACLAGVCLLAAGMAQNALADLEDDRRRKPSRPLPRGDVSVVTVGVTFLALTGAALAIATARPELLPAVLAIVLLTATYHGVLKRHRVPGSAALGALRGLDMALGVLAAGAFLASPSPDGVLGASPAVLDAASPWSGAFGLSPAALACGMFALYVFGASLHASTDDEPEDDAASSRAPIASRAGLGLAGAVLGAGACLLVLATWDGTRAHGVGGATLAALALVRLTVARRTRPAPAVTGVALSNLPLLGAAVCVGMGQPVLTGACVAAFLGGRALLRVYPPS